MRRLSSDDLARAWRNLQVNLDLPSAAIGFATFFALAGLAVAVAGRRPAPRAAAQPIAFNHRIHVEDLELGCADCHEFYETEAFSGLPSEETCALCHDDAESENARERELVARLADGEPLEWQPLFRQPAHVFFSHRRHAVVAELECTNCHGDFASRERPPASVDILTMDECLGCHEEQQAGLDCSDCHR